MVSSPVLWVSFLIAAAIPYAMFLVAYVFEGRRIGNGPDDVPFWKGQSRAFMPGDIGLALFVAVAAYHSLVLTMPSWTSSYWFIGICLCFGALVFTVARTFFYSKEDYTIQQWNSPTKVYHDYVMYWLFASVLAYVCVPAYLLTPWASENVLSKQLGVFGFAVWLLGMVYDITHDEVPNARQHPKEWQPIWRKASR